MKLTNLIAIASVCVCPFLANAEERGTKEEAQSMVERGLAHIKKVGEPQAFKDFSDSNNKEWHIKDVYLFCYDFKAINTCHGANAKLIGKDLSELKTADGQFLIKNLVKIADEKESGWISYEWSHPQTKKIEPKQAYVKRISGSSGLIGAGVYR